MPDTIELATSGRAKCRGCARPIGKGELRFGERHPNAFGDGEMTLWFHLRCAAYKRPEPFLAALASAGPAAIENAVDLEAVAQFGVAHRRVPRINGAERAPTGRARCRSCRELIERGAWRIPLVYFEEPRFEPSGFVHAKCSNRYFSTLDLIERIRHFTPALDAADVDDLKMALESDSMP
jgi:Poly(ADP-ribose) polymerase and DNA-Ligase Zn-finger region